MIKGTRFGWSKSWKRDLSARLWRFSDIIQDDQKVLNKILYGIEKFNKEDNKFTVITLRFSMKYYEKIKNMNRFSKSTIDLLHLMNEYEKNVGSKMKLSSCSFLVDDQLQRIQRGMYQIYYYENLFNSLENIIIINRKQVWINEQWKNC